MNHPCTDPRCPNVRIVNHTHLPPPRRRTPDDIHKTIAECRDLVTRALDNMQVGMLASCPLPHKFIQHPDDTDPWCEACGYSVMGERVKVLPRPALPTRKDTAA